MQLLQYRSVNPWINRTAMCFAVALTLTPLCHAARTIDILPDPHVLADLELRAQQSNPRDQALLYADLADKMSVVLSYQLREGDLDRAEQTLQRMEHYSQLIEADVNDHSKGLKKAEMIMHDTSRRLNDIARAVSGDIRPRLQQAMKQLESAQRSLLTQVFNK